MSKDMTPENEIIPKIWYDFLKTSIEGDDDFGHPRGWHWFWSLYFLHKELPTFPNFQIVSIKKVIPENHWLYKIDYDSIDKPLGPKPAEIYELLQETFVFPAFLKAIKAIKNPEEINKIDFSQINFKELILGEPINFSNFIFPIDTSFEHAEFSHDIEFINAKFLKTTVFNNAIFLRNAYFIKADFSEEANFRNAVFHGATAKFSGAVFNKIADFTDTRFKGYANFKSSDFKGRTSFQRAKFEIHAPRFYNATFNDEMTFSGMKPSKLKQDDVDNYPDFNRKKDKIADASEIHENYRKRIEENQTSYENTSTKLGNQKKYHDEHLFFRNEMYCRQQLEKRWLAWFSYFLYQILSDYGYAMGRALGLWLAHMLVWAGILFIWGFKSGCNTYERIACSLITSASNAHSFLLSKSERLENCYAMANNESTFNLFWAGETILGVLFLFLLLTTLRVRFRFSGITLGNTK